MASQTAGIVQKLIDKGVCIPNPGSVEIGEEIQPERISGQGVVLHSGCKLFGEKTLILRGSVIGREAPATIENCQIGPDVKLNGGFFKESVFLKGVSVGSCAHFREGTVFEEHASAAHSVGVKQTILFPWVTLGSLINFCDCLMAGGTGEKNHSEVGSSYIHFNFTPQQDKATPSLIGDVPSGVMLNQAPIFLGGQGGLVGPSRLTYGLTIAAGTIFRKDELRPNRLVFGGASKSGNIAYTPGAYASVKRIFNNNIYYIANLLALTQWYRHIRVIFLSEEFPHELYDGVLDKLFLGVTERLKRLEAFIKKLSAFHPPGPDKRKQPHQALIEKWPRISNLLNSRLDFEGDTNLRQPFIRSVQKTMATGEKNGEKDYLQTIATLPSEDKNTGTRWLQGIVDGIVHDVDKMLLD